MLFCEPATGQREAWVTKRRTKVDFAQTMKRLVQTYPHAEMIRVVMDNLNTHKPGSLYDTPPPDKANVLLKKLEFHYTPKHGGWLNMAEIEFAAMSCQCLDRRTPDIATPARLVNAWITARNQAGTAIQWQFTSRQARRGEANHGALLSFTTNWIVY